MFVIQAMGFNPVEVHNMYYTSREYVKAGVFLMKHSRKKETSPYRYC